MNDIQIFNNPEFGQIRTVIIDGEAWFVSKDISDKLGYAKPANMVKLVDDDDKRNLRGSDLEPGSKSQVSAINESGLYAAIFGSKQENAKKFKKWVTSEVLPSIRKTGGYKIPQTIPEQIQLLAQGNVELNKRVETVESRITDLEGTMTLDYGQQRFLEKTVSKTVLSVLGGKESNAYKHMGRKVFAECNGNLKDYFKVNARGNVPKKRYEEAVEYAEKWRPCTNTMMLIEQYNAQQNLNFEGGART